MEAFKNALAVLAGIVGLLTALLTLYAKYLDIKKSAARESEGSDPATTNPVPPGPDPAPVPGLVSAGKRVDPAVSPAPSARDGEAAIARAREAVKAPAITLLLAGLVCMVSNLFMAGFGYIDQFVTPLTTESRDRRQFMEAVSRKEVPPPALVRTGGDDGLSEDATVVLTICTMLSLSVASAAAAWAGYGMLRLRSYWLSVAGSFAIMAGGSCCCMAGIPIGIWSLSVLYKPEVAASFR